MQHLYVRTLGETGARRITEAMADEMVRTVDEAGSAFVMVEPEKVTSPISSGSGHGAGSLRPGKSRRHFDDMVRPALPDALEVARRACVQVNRKTSIRGGVVWM